MGTLSQRQEVLGLLASLPQGKSASDAEVMTLMETRRLCRLGIGYVDAHLLAATLLKEGGHVWTRESASPRPPQICAQGQCT